MSGSERKPNVLTAPPGKPFLRTLARAVMDGALPRRGGKPPEDLSRITILLPTRRAARALQDAFLDASGGRALLLPRIKPIAEGNEDLALLSTFSGPELLGAGAEDVPPAVGEVERRLVLTSLVQRWSAAMRKRSLDVEETDPRAVAVEAGAGTAAQAAALAAELARLIDEVETENADLSGIADLVPDRFSEHWQKTLEFLQIVLDWWPAYLGERGVIAPMDRRNRLVQAEARRLAANPPADPMIVAGVTGSIPATAELMRVVATLPQGAVVIPGLDLTLDDASWETIAPQRSASHAPDDEHPGHPEHPQFGLQRLITALGVTRADVGILDGTQPTTAIAGRNRLVSEAMRPARTTQLWQSFTSTTDRGSLRDALQGVSLVETPSAEDEAEAISLMLREVAETPGRTATLVTRDRLLARRVAIRLEAWGIRVDDSAGRPLAKTIPGAFLDLVIEAVATDFAPEALVALIKHPLTRLGRSAGEIRRTARALEIAAFRTLYIGRGLDGAMAAVETAEQQVAEGARRGRAVQRLRVEDWQAVRTLVEAMCEAFVPLAALFDTRAPHALGEIVAAHVKTAEALSRQPEGDTAPGLWAEVAGEAASLFTASLLDESLPPLSIPAREYPDLYRSLIAQEAVRPKVPLHPRLAIWGPFEARLQQPDLVILGSMNDGTWPELGDPGPWLNRPMRLQLGLPAPEEKIGYAAHDFAMLLGADEVVITRALKVDGVPTVASRWLLRLGALLDAMDLRSALQPDKPWLAWSQWRSHTTGWKPVKPPEPRPPLALRPRKLSVSSIETWMANPYAIFAREILRLDPIPLIGIEPDAALRGGIIHAALSEFTKAFPRELPAKPADELMRIVRDELEHLAGNPRVAAFWQMRLERFAQWFGGSEGKRREKVSGLLVELAGSMVLDAPAGPFTVTARADRIDILGDTAIITDYKSGASLAKLRKDAKDGFAPQLALEAAIVLANGFPGLAAKTIAGLRYISASGGEPAGAEFPLHVEDFGKLAEAARRGAERLIADFDDPQMPYRAVRRARFSYDYDDYAHLARAAEWTSSAAAEDEAS